MARPKTKETDLDVEWYAHEIVHYQSEIDSDHRTKETYRTVKKTMSGYVPNEKLSAEEFTRLANREDTQVKVNTEKKKLTGATRATQDTHVTTAFITTTKVIPE